MKDINQELMKTIDNLFKNTKLEDIEKVIKDSPKSLINEMILDSKKKQDKLKD